MSNGVDLEHLVQIARDLMILLGVFSGKGMEL